MKRYLFILSALALLFSACTQVGLEPEPEPRLVQPSGYQAFLSAYKAGNTYYQITATADVLRITLDDESQLLIDVSEVMFEDCTYATPKVVAYDAKGYYLVGGVSTGVKRDVMLSDEESVPFYIYIDDSSVHVRINNGNHLIMNYKAPVPVFKSLPIVYLRTNDGQGIYDKETYKPGTIKIEDPDHKFWNQDVFEATMQIKGRGNSTWGKPKLPYRIKLDEKANLFGMSNDKSWCLLANWVDKSLLRNRVCMGLSEIVGMDWTPKSVPVEVYFNGKYVGLYDFCEHKKVSKERVNIDIAAGDMYFEIESNLDEPVCWTTSHGQPMMFKDPEYPSDEQLAYAKQFFADFETALWAGKFEEVYEKYIDVDSFINYFIVEEFSKDVDGNLRKSTFLTLSPGGKLKMYHLWDFDISFGNCDYYGDGLQPWEGWWTKTQNQHGYGHGWYYHLFMDPKFVTKVKNRWAQVYTQFVLYYNHIDTMVEEMGDAPARNFQKWQILNRYEWPNYKVTGSYEGEVDWLKENYSKRLDWMNRNLAKL